MAIAGKHAAQIELNRLPRLPVRVALIGCGAIARQMHLPVLAGHPGFELAAIVDRNHPRAIAVGKAYAVAQVLTDARQLDSATIDAAVVATPPAFHAQCAIDLMRRGIHVLVEKPIALNAADTEQMVAVARETGCSLAVGYFRRLFPSVRLLKAFLHSEWFGRPLSFTVAGGGMYQWSAATLANMRRETAGGGVLMDFGTHLLDLLMCLFDEPAEVLDYRDNARGGIEANCSIDLLVHHRGSPLKGCAEFARLRELGSFIQIECERATLEYQLTERHRIRVTPREPTLVDFFTGAPRDVEWNAGWIGQPTDEDWFATFAAEYNDWRESIVTGKPPILSGASALPTMKLIDSCYARRGSIGENWVDGGLCARPAVLAQSTTRMPTRVLVTGASGFIGCRVAEVLRLHEGVTVRAVVNNPANASRLSRLDVEMVQANLGENDLPPDMLADCDAVIHCAVGTAYGQPHQIRQVTVEGTRRLAEAALQAGVKRFVHLSSMAVYGTDLEVPPIIPESYARRARKSTNYYGWTKHLAERALEKLHRRGLPVVILRPARVFGPFGGTFVINPLRAVVEGRFGWQGDAECACDMVYVDNVVAAALAALVANEESVAGEAFNISDGDQMSWHEFYSSLAAQLDHDLDKVSSQPFSLHRHPSLFKKCFTWPGAWFRGTKQILKSSEFKGFGKRVLQTDPIGTLPRSLFDRYSGLERIARRLVGADDSPIIYKPRSSSQENIVRMGSAGAQLSLDKSRDQLGYQPVILKPEAISLTIDWIRHARILNA